MLSHLWSKSIKTFCILLSCVAATTTGNVAHADQSPIFGDVTIGNNFSPDPLSVRGMSGGSVAGQQVAGQVETPTGPCSGYFDDKPDHILNLTSKFDYLKLQVQSPQDTTLIVSGPGGKWCNDDFEGKNPGIVGEWSQGTYQIWIGSYQKDIYLPYTINITGKK